MVVTRHIRWKTTSQISGVPRDRIKSTVVQETKEQMVEKWGTQYPEPGIEALSEVNAT